MSWLPKNSMVVPIDFSEQSFAAAESALDFVEDASHLHVIHILPPLNPTEPGVIWGTVDDESRSRHVNEALRERLADPKYNGVDINVAFGDPGNEIAEYAERIEADLIMLPSHGRTGIRRLLIGSVAERVVRLAQCPVLVLRN